MSALGELAGPARMTPNERIRQFCGYITNDADVAMHVNRLHGTSVTAARVAEIRRAMGRRRDTQGVSGQPEPSDMPRRINAARKSDAAFRKAMLEAGGVI